MAVNQVCHIEWQVTDVQRAQAFYAGLFDWKFQSFGDTMVVFGTGTEHIGGLTKVEKVEPSSSPSVWIEVDNIEEYVTRARNLGGSLKGEKHPVPSVGWSATLGDPDGNSIGIVQFDRK